MIFVPDGNEIHERIHVLDRQTFLSLIQGTFKVRTDTKPQKPYQSSTHVP